MVFIKLAYVNLNFYGFMKLVHEKISVNRSIKKNRSVLCLDILWPNLKPLRNCFLLIAVLLCVATYIYII